MSHRGSAVSGIAAAAALALVSAVVLMGCVAGPSGSSTGRAAAAPPSSSPTLNPNQLEEQRRSLGLTPPPPPTPNLSPTPTAVASETARPTPTPFDPELEAVLPASLRGVPLTRWSAPLSAFDTGGDMCSLICPAEPKAFASVSGLDQSKITVAAAIAGQTSGLRTLIAAIRFPGVATSRLVEFRIGEKAKLSSLAGVPPDRTTVGTAPATADFVLYPPFFEKQSGEYLLARGDVLFIVFGDPPTADGRAPADVLLAIQAVAGN